MSRLLASLTVLLGMATPAQSQWAGGHLEEVKANPLHGLILQRIAAEPARGAVVISTNPAAVLFVDTTLTIRQRIAIPPQVEIIAAHYQGEDAFEAVGRTSAVLYTLDQHGVRDSTSYHLGGGTLIDAVWHSEHGWLFAVRDDAGRLEIRDRKGVVLNRRDGFDAVTVHMTSTRDRVILTQAEVPYKAVSLSLRGEQATTFQDTSVPTGDDKATWVSMPILPLSNGYVRTLTDIRSDKRVLLFYDNAGKMARAHSLTAPLGIASGDEEWSVLYGARSAVATEIVLFRWAPSESGDHPPHEARI